jgi:hypothetical protein
MYEIINKSSGIVVIKFLNRDDAAWWLECNNLDNDGLSLGLYEIRKVKSKQ